MQGPVQQGETTGGAGGLGQSRKVPRVTSQVQI